MSGMFEDVEIKEDIARGRLCVLEADNTLSLYTGPIALDASKPFFISARKVKKGEILTIKPFEEGSAFLVQGVVGDDVA